MAGVHGRTTCRRVSCGTVAERQVERRAADGRWACRSDRACAAHTGWEAGFVRHLGSRSAAEGSAPAGPVLKTSVPGPYTLSGRLLPGKKYKDRLAVTEALLPFVRKELEDLVAAGCTEITVDEPSMSCYAYKEDTKKFVDIFNRTVQTVVGKCRLSTHMCFGNFKGRPVGYRSIKPMLPDFLDLSVDEIHIELANREFAEVELLAAFAEKMDVAAGVVDVKNYYIETPEDVADRIRKCLQYVPAEKLSVAPDCGLSQTARWASRLKLANMVKGANIVRQQL